MVAFGGLKAIRDQLGLRGAVDSGREGLPEMGKLVPDHWIWENDEDNPKYGFEGAKGSTSSERKAPVTEAS